MYQNDPQKCLTGEIRCSYVSVHTPRQINGQGKPKYTMTARKSQYKALRTE